MVLIIPFGVSAGYVQGPIGYLLRHAGVSVGQAAGIVALSVLPHTYKFAWAPVVDTTLDQKRWYLMAGIASSLGIASLGMFPATRAGLALLATVVFAGSCATTFLGMSVESLMAYSTPEDQKGRAGGWFQAGNLGGVGLGAGLGLWLSQRLPWTGTASAIVGGLCLLCCGALFFVPTPERTHGREGFVKGLVEVVRDLVRVARGRAGLLALILCFLPIGSGAASGLWATVADDWKASADTVALVTGLLAGVISALGCIVGGWICDRMDRKLAYVLYGLLQAACAIGMALMPHTQPMFVAWASLYAFITGLTYAGFSAFVLEAIGKGAAATKYNVYASLSNFPIYYMTNVDGWAHDRWSATGMLFTEAALCMIGAAVFMGLIAAFGRARAPRVAGSGEAG
jgi:PAT family beta-lactamase induction signal transducer AmpG